MEGNRVEACHGLEESLEPAAAYLRARWAVDEEIDGESIKAYVDTAYEKGFPAVGYKLA